MKKKKIHFILPSGGIKGSFQAGFIHRLLTKYNNLFEIYQIDGSSCGALNGLSMCCNDPNIIIQTWKKIKKLDDIFPPASDVYFLKKKLAAFYSINSLGFSNNTKIKKIINDNKANIINNLLPKFNCCTVNIDTGEEEYINGSNDKIYDYTLASASPWILTPPIKINNNYYTDGALFNRDPIQNIDKSDADLILVIGSNRNDDTTKDKYGTNLLEYCNRLIILASNEQNKINRRYLYTLEKNNNNVVVIDKKGKGEITDPNLNNIDSLINDNLKLGEKEADKFAIKYLIKQSVHQ